MTQPQTPPYRIIGYYAGWAIYDRQYFVTDIPADQLTHINYAFALISDDGEIMLQDEWADTQYPYPGDDDSTELRGNFGALQRLKAEHPHLQTLISVGGWTGSGNFSDAALTAESRERFARSCVDFMLRYGFDGIDLDWEYPTGGGLAGNTERPEDAENFIRLLAELRALLDAQGERDSRHYPLTIAVGAGRAQYAPLDWARIAPLLDWINVMTYDMAGAWSVVTGHHAPLYDSTDSPPEVSSADTTIQALLALGIPANKLVMGVPFYGRGWAGVQPHNNGLHQRFTNLPPGTYEAGAFDYHDLAAHYVGRFTRYWDDRAQAPYLFDEAAGIFITYEDADSLRLKTEYVRAHGLGGIMFWELSGDDEVGTLVGTIWSGLNGE